MKKPVQLHISSDLSLPIDFITSTQAILAKKRVGKTHTAQVLAEELLAAGQQVIVIDVTSAWWGLQSSADGKSAGYPITIFGGRHGNLPLEASSGEELANAIVDDRFSAILDVRLLKKSQRLRFIADFLETLYDKNTEAVHLFCDEADAYIPQQTFSPEQARALGAADELVRRGGIGGIGVTLISQRAQTLNKNVLSQVDMLTVLRMNHPKDLGAIKDWVVEHVDADKAKEMMASLPSLPKGEAWVWAPEHGIFKRISVRAKRTYDSGRTPKVGEQVKAPKVLAKVDLERLGAKIKSAVERAKENDPKLMRAELARTKLELKKAQDAAQRVAAQPQPVVKPGKPRAALKDGQISKLERLLTRAETHYARVQEIADQMLVKLTVAIHTTTVDSSVLHTELVAVRDAIKATLTEATASKAPAQRPMPPNRVVTGPQLPLRVPYLTATPKTKTEIPDGLAPAHLRLLSAIAWWESVGVDEPDLAGVAFIAKTSTKSSAFNNNRSRLRAAGYIDYPTPGTVKFTESGRALAPPPSIPPTNAAIQEAILGKVQPAVGRLLTVLIENYPNEISLEQLAKDAGTSESSSAFNNNRSWLRARGLAEYPRNSFVRASTLLFPEAS